MKKMTMLAATAALLTLAACSKSSDADAVKEPAAPSQAAEKVTEKVSESAASMKETRSLSDILAAQSDAHIARYQYRNPAKTLAYFGVKPGMTVAEVLPGGGWYSKILIPYLGDEGHLVGIDYSVDMWGKFGGFATEEFLAKKKTWAADWTKQAADWQNNSNTKLSAFAFGDAPSKLTNKVDVVFLPRSIHHLNRFEQAHLAEALADMKKVLKPDGIVGIVAHRGGEDQADDWANGDNGYMKQSKVIAIMEEAGFELAGKPSEINANPKDKASSENDDKVWRLPPTLGTSREDPELKAKMIAIGETDRMTLKFRLK